MLLHLREARPLADDEILPNLAGRVRPFEELGMYLKFGEVRG